MTKIIISLLYLALSFTNNSLQGWMNTSWEEISSLILSICKYGHETMGLHKHVPLALIQQLHTVEKVLRGTHNLWTHNEFDMHVRQQTKLTNTSLINYKRKCIFMSNCISSASIAISKNHKVQILINCKIMFPSWAIK